MTDLMEVLFKYSEEHLIRGLLEQKGEYPETSSYVEKGEEKLRALIGEEHREFVDALLEEQHLLTFFYEEAQFEAGFRVALALTR